MFILCLPLSTAVIQWPYQTREEKQPYIEDHRYSILWEWYEIKFGERYIYSICNLCRCRISVSRMEAVCGQRGLVDRPQVWMWQNRDTTDVDRTSVLRNEEISVRQSRAARQQRGPRRDRLLVARTPPRRLAKRHTRQEAVSGDCGSRISGLNKVLSVELFRVKRVLWSHLLQLLLMNSHTCVIGLK